MDIAGEKKRLRALMRQRLKGLSGEDIAAQSIAACGRITELKEFERAGLILAYMAMPKECSPAPLVELALALGREVAFPRCVEGGRLELYIPGEDGFLRGAYGILEPDPEKGRRVQAIDVELIIAPGVAFDRACRRLGHGAGYYDRLLAEAAAPAIGLALEEQLVEAVPAEEHDRPLSMIAWRNGIYCK